MWGFDRPFLAGAGTTVATSYSAYAGATGATNNALDPGFAGPGDWRLRPDSPLVDAGRPGPLSESEPHEDALGFVRVVDGNGDGVPRRDIGAQEVQPPAPPLPPGNVLANPGAESGDAASDDRSSPAPPGWSRTGAFTFVHYGTVAGLVPFPSERVAQATAAGEAFFAAGPGKDGSATQLYSIADSSPEIDMGKGAVTLSALLGGYRGSADGAIAEAAFRDPFGRTLGDGADRPGHGRRAGQRDQPAAARDERPAAAAHAHDRRHAALDRVGGRLRRRLLRQRRARPAGARPHPAHVAERAARAPVRRRRRCSTAAWRWTRAAARGSGWRARAPWCAAAAARS